MGFNGGGGGQLLNHRHNGTVPLDGGPLDFKNITQGSLSAGSVTFSDGVHLQELAIGGGGQQLQVNAGATAPEWAAGASVGQYQLIETYKAPAAASTYTFSFAALTPDDISALVLIYSMSSDASLNLLMEVENIGGAGENETNINRLDSSANTPFQAADLTSVQLCSSTLLSADGQTANGYAYIMNTDAGTKRPCCTGSVSSQNTAATEYFGSCSFVSKDVFSSIEVKTSTSTWKQDSLFSLYKILR